MDFKLTINILKSSEEDVRNIIQLLESNIPKTTTYSVWLTNCFREEPILTIYPDTSCTRANWYVILDALHKDYQKHLIEINSHG